MSARYGLLSIALVALLAGCGEKKPQPPKVVYVEVAVPADIPDELLKDCPIAEPADDTVGEALAVASARKTSLKKCNEDKAALRKLDSK